MQKVMELVALLFVLVGVLFLLRPFLFGLSYRHKFRQYFGVSAPRRGTLSPEVAALVEERLQELARARIEARRESLETHSRKTQEYQDIAQIVEACGISVRPWTEYVARSAS